MANTAQPLALAELSWPELNELIDDIDIVLIPVGSQEQHGPNLSMSMDIAAATSFCRKASEMVYPRAIVAPSMPWGVSHHHMNFPGTITLSSDTFIQILVEVVGSLMEHGFERFLIVNGHGGNNAPLGDAVVRINEELGPTWVGFSSYFRFADPEVDKQFDMTGGAGVGSGIVGHACQLETSWAMYLAPEVVKTEALAPGELTELTHGFRTQMRKYSVTVPYRFDEYTSNGALGDATRASLEYGTAVIESALENFAEFIGEVVAVSPIEE